MLDLFADLQNRLPESLCLYATEIRDNYPELMPLEHDHVENAGPKRFSEFSTGRWLIRHALAELGRPSVAIPKGEFGQPIWPDGIVGSLTHSHQHCALVIGRAAEYLSIGFDLEMSSIDHSGTSELILSPDEPASYQSPELLRRVFSAKEAVYKCISPICQTFLEFDDLSVRLDDNSFTVTTRTLAVSQELLGRGIGYISDVDSGVATLFLIRHD